MISFLTDITVDGVALWVVLLIWITGGRTASGLPISTADGKTWKQWNFSGS